jgi:ABC-type nitrate/sulfonate/bicarbonate transport system ATPase subunit
MKKEYYYTNEEILKVENVSLQYGEKLILRDINLSIFDVKRKDQASTGQVVGLLGPSGRGKTQLFRILSGLNMQPTTGKVFIHGKPVNPGDVGVVFQNYPLFPHHTVEGNLKIALEKNVKLSKAEKTDKINFYLERFKLADKKKYYPISLSGGQRQRIAIIQQLLCSENFLLLDEPFSGLDINMIHEVSQVILEVANMSDFNTVIIVSHDINATASISDKIWMLGYEYDAQGNAIPGATLRYQDNLMDLGLSWNYPNVANTYEFANYVKDVRQRFQTL